VVPAAIRRSAPSDGLQPLRLARDWRQVLAVIEVAFGEHLDTEARRALQSMRPPPLLGSLIALLDSLSPPGEGMMPGFVWREGRRVIGTASVRHIRTFHHGWLISNVAVHPDWQGRGIGRELMEAAVDFARGFGGAWVVLQVRDDNAVAQKLYASMGFQKVGAVVRLRRPAPGHPRLALPVEGLRPARWSDGSSLARLARTLTPPDVLWHDSQNRALYQTGPLSRLVSRLKRIRRLWWVRDEARPGGYRSRVDIRAAVGLERDLRLPWHRLRLLILPEVQHEELASQLIDFALARLTDLTPLPVEIEYPDSDTATQSALVKAGFERAYALNHMRLNLR
jgi:ribosomal protein S18 acetylase RimI-like enzyme